jgi:hypothetical protein
MVKHKGPIQSMEAAGSLGGALIVQKNKGRTYMRKLTAPAQPRSGDQVGYRAMFAYLSTHWQAISAADQATWEALAADSTFSPFNAYLQTNQFRWGLGEDPGEAYPIAESDAAGSITSFSAINQGRGLVVPYLLSVTEQNQGVRIHRSLTPGFTPALENLIAAKGPVASPSDSIRDTPLDAGTYYYRIIPFSVDGVTGTPATERSGTVP